MEMLENYQFGGRRWLPLVNDLSAQAVAPKLRDVTCSIVVHWPGILSPIQSSLLLAWVNQHKKALFNTPTFPAALIDTKVLM
jgi:hypothetical protein